MGAIDNQGVYVYPNVPYDTVITLANYVLSGGATAFFACGGVYVWSKTGATDFQVDVYVNGVWRAGGPSNGNAFVSLTLPTDQISNGGYVTMRVVHNHQGMLHQFSGVLLGNGNDGIA